MGLRELDDDGKDIAGKSRIYICWLQLLQRTYYGEIPRALNITLFDVHTVKEASRRIANCREISNTHIAEVA